MKADIRGVLIDLDDTLVSQSLWLAGAWKAVAAEASKRSGVDPSMFEEGLRAAAANGSAKGGIIDTAVAALHLTVPIGPLVEAFSTYRAITFPPYPGVPAALERLRAAVPIALVTDGQPAIQRAKLNISGLIDMFDAVVLSDELGRQHRKPDPLPFRTALDALGVEPQHAAFIGDRPETDIVGAAALGMLTVRVGTGEYANLPDVVIPAIKVPDVVAAVDWLLL